MFITYAWTQFLLIYSLEQMKKKLLQISYLKPNQSFLLFTAICKKNLDLNQSNLKHILCLSLKPFEFSLKERYFISFC